MEKTINNLDHILKLKPNEDYIWAAVKSDLFETYHPYASDKTSYFGSYERPYRDTSYSINCIEGVSPKVYKLEKLLYLGFFESKGTFDKVFVFSDASEHNNDLRFDGYILSWRQGFRGSYDWQKQPKISVDIFENCKRQLDIDLVAFTEEDGLKICRELNGKWKNDMRYINFTETSQYIKKTLKYMLKQLNDFMRSEYMVDPKEEIEKDLNG